MRGSIVLLSTSFLVVCQSLPGQGFGLGVIGGASVTTDFQRTVFPIPYETIFSSTPKRWIAGAMLELRLPAHLSVEIDCLYHELGFTSVVIAPVGPPSSSFSASVITWEFPVLAKYRFSLPLVKPFIEGGPSFRGSTHLYATSPSNHGFAIGAGVEIPVWKLKIAPQIRYLRWAEDGPALQYLPSTKPNQIELLVSLSI
jgi:hypothetical protein